MNGDVVKKSEVQPPKVFTGQQELYNKLMENGIDVYVMTAASEELVRKARSQGFDLQLTGQVTDAIRVIGAVSLPK